MLQEVVAIGYGTKTRATTTGAVDLVNSDKLMNRPVTNTAELFARCGSPAWKSEEQIKVKLVKKVIPFRSEGLHPVQIREFW